MFAPVRPRSSAAEAAARARLDTLVKPLGALGRLEDLAAWLAGAQDRCPPAPLARVRVVVLAGDHGVSRDGVSAYPPEVTAAMVGAFVAGVAGVCVCRPPARRVGAGLRHRRRRRPHRRPAGGDRAQGPPGQRRDLPRGRADTRRAARACAAGAAIADEQIAAGVDLLIPGDMGIGNTTVAAALVAACWTCRPPPSPGPAPASTDRPGAQDRRHRRRPRPPPAEPGPIGLLTALGSADARRHRRAPAPGRGARGTGAAGRRVLQRLRPGRRAPRSRAPPTGGSPDTGPPSRRSGWRCRRSACDRSSTWACGSARAAARWSPCRCCAPRRR